ncbi:MAG TPA: acyltransferase family protein [Rhodanobacteraceae bacterium]|nr:acyltransferase family protein [Rhodanobacteraceae bacterium]
MTNHAEAVARRPPATPEMPLSTAPARVAPGARHDDGYRRDIDGLRAFAVLAVVAFHAFPWLMPGGFVGVDVFFVISGYLISGLISERLAAGRFTFADFYARRIRRIFPALVVVLAACLAFGWFALLPGEFEQLGKHIAAGMGFVSNFALWREAGYFDESASMKPLLHLWSLGIEEQFYLVWPLALFAFAKWRRSALALIVAVGVVSFAINLATIRHRPVAAFYSPASRFWELQAGCLLAALSSRSAFRTMTATHANALSTLGAVLLALTVFLLDESHAYPGWRALAPTAGAFLLIAAGPGGWFNRNVLAQPAAVFVGLVSYPLYLWHWPLLSFATISARGIPPFGVRVAAVLASFALAAATYVLVEKPIRFGAKRRAWVPALVALSLAVGVAGYATFANDGVPSRFPPEIRELASFKYEYKTDARYPDCWLSNSQALDAFAPDCIDTTPGRERVLVWGDSHAARLYAGLKPVFGDTLAISQLTRDACAPLLDNGYDLCRQSNAWILREIERIRPQTVVLFGLWAFYEKEWDSDAARQTLHATIDALEKAGVAKIVIIGPAPVWKGSLPKQMYDAWAIGRPFHVVPERLTTGVNPAVVVVDGKMRRDLEGSRATYVSLIDFFCDARGCLTHTPEGPTHPITFDYGHLTTDGATLVARKLEAERILP